MAKHGTNNPNPDGGAATGGGTPPSGGSGISTHPLAIQVKGIFSDLYHYAVNLEAMSGLADPDIDKLSKAAADATNKWMKPNNPLRHPLCARGLGWFSGMLDKVASSQPEPLRTGLRKFSDFVDGFRSSFYGKETGVEHEVTKMDDAAKAAILKDLAECEGAFAKNFMKAILECMTPAERAAVRAAYQDGALTWREVMDSLLHGSKKPEEPKVPWSERFDAAMGNFDRTMEKQLGPAVHHLQRKVDVMNARTQAREAQQKRAAAAQQPSKADKFLKKLARVLF